MKSFKDLTGQRFGRLTAIKRIKVDKKAMWECQCDCGNTKFVTSSDLMSGKVKSCGCLRSETSSNWMKKYKYKRNEYRVIGNYMIGYTSNKNTPFYFDIEDYDKIKDYCWYERKDGYIGSRTHGEENLMQWLIMGEKQIDHVNREKNDNRKNNLRKFENIQQNLRNKNTYKNNTSGHTGVSKSYDKWQARVIIDGKTISLGVYNNLEDAIKARKEGKKKYYGDWARQDK